MHPSSRIPRPDAGRKTVRPPSPRQLKRQTLEHRRAQLTPQSDFAYRALVLYRIRAARKNSKFSQADVGMVLGRPQTFVSDIETGLRELNVQSLRAISVAIGVTTWDLVNEAENDFEVALQSRVRDAFMAARRAEAKRRAEAGEVEMPRDWEPLIWDSIRDAVVKLRAGGRFEAEMEQCPIPLPPAFRR